MERENSTSGIKVQALEKKVTNKTVNYKEKRILVEDKNMQSCYKIKDLLGCDFKRRRILFVMIQLSFMQPRQQYQGRVYNPFIS